MDGKEIVAWWMTCDSFVDAIWTTWVRKGVKKGVVGVVSLTAMFVLLTALLSMFVCLSKNLDISEFG